MPGSNWFASWCQQALRPSIWRQHAQKHPASKGTGSGGGESVSGFGDGNSVGLGELHAWHWVSKDVAAYLLDGCRCRWLLINVGGCHWMVSNGHPQRQGQGQGQDSAGQDQNF